MRGGDLNAVDFAAIADVEWVHDKEEDDGFEGGFAGVAEDEDDKEELGADEDEEMGGGDAQDEQPDDDDNYGHGDVDHLVELVDGRFGVV